MMKQQVAFPSLSSSSSEGGTGRSDPRQISVLIVDDHPALREVLADTIQSVADFTLCGEACSVQEALQLLERVQPHVAIVDLSLGDAHGLDLVRHIRVRHPAVQVLVFSMHEEDVYAERAIRAGAVGYLMKSEPAQHLIAAVRTVQQGEVYVSRRIAARLLSRVVRHRELQQRFTIDALTEREKMVFQMLGKGQSLEEITDQLALSRKTVETYRRRAKEKLGFETVNDLLQYAIQWMNGRPLRQDGPSAV